MGNGRDTSQLLPDMMADGDKAKGDGSRAGAGERGAVGVGLAVREALYE